MTKGVISPWASDAPTPQQIAEQMVDATLEGAPRQEVTFDGRAFQIVVGFYTFERDVKKLSVYARDALGRALSDLLKIDPALGREFSRQAIDTNPDKILAAKVTLVLGPVTLYVKASSFDVKMAELMAIDRIALAIQDARSISPKIKAALSDYDILIARKA